jgi:hypothetical protein
MKRLYNFIKHSGTCSGEETKAGKTSSGFLLLTTMMLTLASLHTVQGQITGRAFRDFNSDGIQQAGEPGREGIIVKAYSNAAPPAKDAFLGQTTTDATGDYLLNPASYPVRLEFIIPTGLCNLDPDEDFAAPNGATYGTAVQFADAPGVHNFIINYPFDYSVDPNPYVFAPCFVNGDPLAGGNAGEMDAFVRFSYLDNGHGTNSGYPNPPPMDGVGPYGNAHGVVAKASQVGSVWGVAYSRQSKQVFTAAFLKRHAGMGPLGSGGIYKIDANSFNTGTNYQWLDFDSDLGIPTNDEVNPYVIPMNGSNKVYFSPVVGTNSERGLGPDMLSPSRDAAAWEQVGKVSFGDMDISEDGRYLYVINLYDRKLYQIDLVNAESPVKPTMADVGTKVKGFQIPNPCGGAAGEYRPFALKFARGKVFVGMVCSGQAQNGDIVGTDNDMNAFVYEFDFASQTFDPTPVLQYPLNYRANTPNKWLPWTPEFQNCFECDGYPIVADIEFDGKGNMILGMMDRRGHEAGWYNWDLDGQGLIAIAAVGDILRATRNTNVAACDYSISFIPEYYEDDKYHLEPTQGGLTVHRTSDYDNILCAYMDPVWIWSGGAMRFDNNTGKKIGDGYEIYYNLNGAAGGPFGKAHGIGDFETVEDVPPIEIGNYVWADIDGDGIQDGGELGIPGVTVQLKTAAGTVVGTTTTAPDGTYYFFTNNVPDGDPTKPGAQPGPQPFLDYKICIAASEFAAGKPLLHHTLTLPNQTGLGLTDLSDSDGITDPNGDVCIPFTAGDRGENDHSFDFGFIPADYGDLPDTYGTTDAANGPWHTMTPLLRLGSCIDADANGQPSGIANGDDNLPGAPVSTLPAGAYPCDDEDGIVFETPMIPGNTACVRVTATNATGAAAKLQAWIDFSGDGQFQSGEELTTLDFAPTGANVPAGGLNNAKLCFTVPATATFNGGMAMMRFRLSQAGSLTALGGAPDGEVEDYKLPLAKIGNLVWSDYNNDGQQNEPTTAGINNITVKLTWLGPNSVAGGGDDVEYTTTTSNMGGTDGMYMFVGLTPGEYVVTPQPPAGYVAGLENTGGSDVTDSDTHAGQLVSINNPINLPTGENGTGDTPGASNGFGDNQDNLTLDFNYVSVDYGDLPESYGTTNGANGPCHAVNPQLKLGAAVDGDPNGQPDSMAGLMTGGDDNDVDGDDEDGVSLFGPMIPGNNACLTVTAMNMTGLAAKLQGWIDFNGDGQFQGGEQLSTLDFNGGSANVPTTGLANATLCFAVPANATFNGGQAMMRFRLSPDGGLNATGPNLNGTIPVGEVEDYKAPLAKVGTMVWNDYDNNGQQNEPASAGINGVTVRLTWLGPDGVVGGGNDVNYTTTTSTMNGNNGQYMFLGLASGMYKLSVPTTPTSFQNTLLNNGGSDVTDADDPTGVMVSIPNPISLILNENGTGDNPGGTNNFADNQDDLTYDFGYIQRDYGDLPDTYGTTTGANGASQIVTPDLKLGACVDAETTGQPDAMAGLMSGGDDNNTGTGSNGQASQCGDDEDGIQFVTPLIPGENACVRVTATNNTGAAAKLQGWIDFNGDGQFQAGEQLNTGAFVGGATVPVNGLTAFDLCFTVPVTATFQGGQAMVRFRLSQNGGLAATGAGGIGEVEDYKVQLAKVGNLVWNDYNNDGQQNEPASTGINGVTVTLTYYGTNGVPGGGDDRVYSTTTSTMGGTPGMYMFLGLISGEYLVTPQLPTGYVPGRENLNPDVSDSDTHAGQPVSIPNPVNLPTGENSTGDVPGGTNGFADSQDNLTIDFNYVQVDYGDLPETYGTTTGANGPCHVVNPGLKLGASSDGDPNGQPDSMAGLMTGGDDNDADGDDEDGISLFGPMIPGNNACLTVTAMNMTGSAAKLQGWIDFNGDGQFQTGEQLNSGAFAGNGATVPTTGLTNATLCFTVPANATFDGGQAMMRFRLSPAGGLNATGNNGDGTIPVGEVEDYKAPLAKVGSLVWNDYDNNGQQNEPASTGLNGVAVQLTWLGPDGVVGGGNDVNYTTTTSTMNGANGQYMFLGLASGMYKLSVPTAPASFQNTLLNSGSDVTDADDPSGVMVNIPNPISLIINENGTGDNPGGTNNFADNQDDLTYDFGYIQRDYGDLPDTYGTTTNNNGPSHVVTPNLKLGACVDAETTGQPDAMAGLMSGGDDNNTGTGSNGQASQCGDDEDGIQFVTPLIPGENACVRVTATNTTGAAAKLQGWIDFNGDGQFQAGEQLSTGAFAGGATVPVGGLVATDLCFTVPNTATFQGGQAMVRFRVSQNGGLTATGADGIGEVEDYKVSLAKVGNLVWTDYNYDGIQNEPLSSGINGAVVKLDYAGPDGDFGTTGDNRTFNATTSTMNGNLGQYMFLGLISGNYKLSVPVAPNNSIPTKLNQGGNDVKDSDDPTGVSFTVPTPITLPTGENGMADAPGTTNGFPDLSDDLTFDFGYVGFDYGDLPNTYGTTKAAEGPYHVITPDLMLGACVDSEQDGQPDAMAGLMGGGDDGTVGDGVLGTCATAGDDENGVVFETPLIPGWQACLRINAINNTGSTARLQGWIDFNGNGVFDANERLNSLDFTGNGINVPVGGITNGKFCFLVPSNATFQGGFAMARFRLSPNGGLGTGNQANAQPPLGEVEDYKVVLAKVGNFVWWDYDHDGQQDPGEPGINNASVKLTWFGPNQNPGGGDDVSYTTTTNFMNGQNGQYMFFGLISGKYSMMVQNTPLGFTPTKIDKGSDVTDADNPAGVSFMIMNPVNQITGENGTGDVPGGTNGFPDNQDDLTFDFGYIAKDFGDLPNTFGTTIAFGGAKSRVDPRLFLGTSADGEEDGQPGTGGTNDDTVVTEAVVGSTGQGDDENGITLFEKPMIPSYSTCVRMTINNSTGAPAVCQMWIDFNGNNTFDANEQVTTGTFAPNGAVVPNGGWVNQQVCFDVPASAIFNTGTAIIRVRLSPNGGLNPFDSTDPDAPIEIGEVEDYVLNLAKTGNLVWNDFNNDGIQNEPITNGLDNITVNLVWSGTDLAFGTPDDQTYTTVTAPEAGVTGKYNFCGLITGTYKLVIPTNPPGFVPTQLNIGSDVTDADDPTGELLVIPVLPGLPTGENGTGDDPGTNNAFPDTHDILTKDFGFIAKDYGDLPNTFGTTTATSGPVHVVNTNLRLGTNIDSEFDGQPDPMAGLMGGGDDNAPGLHNVGGLGDDEGGVIFESPMIPGSTACLRVTAINTLAAPAVLQMWVDFNGNGTFDAGEQVNTGAFAQNGAAIPVGGLTNAQLCYTVPSTATFTGGQAMVRFRISPAGGLTPNGPAAMPFPIGEVEDYKVPVAKIGSYVWNDNNNDGLQNEPGTNGLNNVQVNLVWAGPDANFATTADNQTFTTTTAAMAGVNGQYMFWGITPGSYKLSIPTAPPGFIPTQLNIGTNDVIDADDPAGVMVMIPNPINLPTNENGTGDTPGGFNNYPDNQDDFTYDFGFVSVDYGDLPNTYGTLIATGGPRHVVNPNLKLGASVDGELEAQPEAMAGSMTGGDDNSNGGYNEGGAGDDENGVIFETPLIPGFPACVRVSSMNNTGAAAVLQGWIDFNGDGDVNDAGEQLNTGSFAAAAPGAIVPNGTTTNQFCFDVPATATFQGGAAFARFRLSPTGGLTAGGPSAMPYPIGEVEDYKTALAHVGNYVWIDANINGIQDEPGVLGINNVTVELRWAGPDANFATTIDNRTYTNVTAQVNGINGKYLFSGLIPGMYKVVVPPFGYVPTLVIDVNGNTQEAIDADDPAGVMVNIPNPPTTLATGENGTGDAPLIVNGFPDNQADFRVDFGYLGFDFGDLPNTFATTQSATGAVHTVNPDLYLGSCVDVDIDGQPEAMAGFMTGGDDGNQGPGTLGTCTPAADDENGIRFVTPLIPGAQACVEVTARNNTGGNAVLQGWIDYNGDGAFQANEQLTTGSFAPGGANIPNGGVNAQLFCFDVPANALYNNGAAMTRFRLSKNGGLAASGPAVPGNGVFPTGEVEDHKTPLALIGNYNWMDNPDIEGDQDLSEMALSGIKLNLIWSGIDNIFGNADDRTYSVVTDANGKYEFRGLIPSTNYRLIPEKYTAANAAAGQNIAPARKILTIPNLPTNDNLDSDANPSISVSIPNLTTAFLPTGENGIADNNGQNAFPDNQENLSIDLGWIDEPKLAAALAITGFAKSGTCGHFDVFMDLCIKNTGTAPLASIQAALNLAGGNAFGTSFLGLTTNGAPTIVSSTAQQNPVLNAGYNGAATAPGANLFNGTSGLLWPGEQVCIRIRFEVNPTATGAPFAPKAQSSVSGKAQNFQGVAIPDFFNGGAQFVATDLSDDGRNPDTTNPEALGDLGTADDPTILGNCWQTTQQLVGNDLVYVSIDNSCSALVNASDLLEGEDDDCTEVNYPLGGFYAVKIFTIATHQPVPNPIPASYFGQTLQYEVEHIMTCNKTWGTLKMEDKLPPEMECHDVDLNCAITNYEPGYLKNTLGITDAFPTVTDCSNFTLTFSDTWHDLACGQGFNGVQDLSAYVERIWTAKDVWNNVSVCTTYVYFHRLHVNDFLFPADATVSCSNPNTDPASTGAPYVTAFGLNWPIYPNNGFCEANAIYTDDIVPICDGTHKVLRTWKLVDWCLPTTPYPPTQNPLYYIQVIKVIDDQGPTIACPANITVTTDPFNCCATANLPDVIISDNCSRVNNINAKVKTYEYFTGEQTGIYDFDGTLTDFPGNNHWTSDTMGTYGYTSCLPIGTHTVTYTAQDDCSNTSTCSFKLTVADYQPPVAACDQYTVVAIGSDDTADCYTPADGCDGAGVTWVHAKTFDDGSTDNCNSLHFTVRRMDPFSTCITGLNDCEKAVATAESDSIKFYCCEVGTTQTVILRVYQTDVNGDIMNGPDGTPLYNECMVNVEVQDKIKPFCQPPANVTVACENFDATLWAYGKASVYDNCCLDTSKVYQGQCGLSHSANLSQFDTVCNKGTITRTFKAYDCHGLTSQCTQRVIVTYNQNYFVKFPNDVIVTVCDGTGNYGEPTFFGEDCELLGVSYEDQIFTVVPDACFKIERTWTIINWCTYNPNIPCIEVPNPNPNATTNNPANLPGPIVSAAGTLAPWAPTVVKINPTDALATNYSTFWNKDANCYRYNQIIKVIDTQDPVVENCPASPVEVCDITPNDPLLWNETYWWDNLIGQHDLCEGPTDLTITATDACSGSNMNIRYLLFLDLDGDGTMETVINSVNTGIAGLGWNNVPFGNGANANYTGGTSRAFDGRPVAFNQKYGFAIQTTTAGTKKTAAVRWNTQQSQSNYTIPELPYGTHKIKWFVEDGCGNESICEYTFVVKDCKKPTVVCLNGLSVNIMPTQMIQMWASDFLKYTEDNCTPASQLKIGIRKSGTGTGFPVDNNGNPITNVTFTCDELGTQLVELWSIDKAGNADFCETYVIVQDNNGNCPNATGAKVAGALATEATNGVEEGSVEITGAGAGIPNFTFTTMTDNAGAYKFNAIPYTANSTVTPNKDDNPLNGVSTYDLVLISKHILGVEPLSSPYKMIAADANKSGSITTFDIVELRKLILGIYSELPTNTSWRFVDKSYNFPNAANPFQEQFGESKSIANIAGDMSGEDFVSVKVGDVNGTAIANSLMSADDRTAGTLLFDVSPTPALPGREGVRVGQTFTVNLTPDQLVAGYQFTLNTNGLEVVDVTGLKGENYAVFADAITFSVDGQAAQGVINLTLKATKSGKLSEMMSISSRITKAEAYPAYAKASAGKGALDVALRFNTDGTHTIAGVGFELYQNQPNPFVNKTMIGFHLPASPAEASAQAGESSLTTVTLTVYDETGRIVHTEKGAFAKGYNSFMIDKSLIHTVGALHYKVETATDSAAKLMIQSK